MSQSRKNVKIKTNSQPDPHIQDALKQFSLLVDILAAKDYAKFKIQFGILQNLTNKLSIQHQSFKLMIETLMMHLYITFCNKLDINATNNFQTLIEKFLNCIIQKKHLEELLPHQHYIIYLLTHTLHHYSSLLDKNPNKDSLYILTLVQKANQVLLDMSRNSNHHIYKIALLLSSYLSCYTVLQEDKILQLINSNPKAYKTIFDTTQPAAIRKKYLEECKRNPALIDTNNADCFNYSFEIYEYNVELKNELRSKNDKLDISIWEKIYKFPHEKFIAFIQAIDQSVFDKMKEYLPGLDRSYGFNIHKSLLVITREYFDLIDDYLSKHISHSAQLDTQLKNEILGFYPIILAHKSILYSYLFEKEFYSKEKYDESMNTIIKKQQWLQDQINHPEKHQKQANPTIPDSTAYPYKDRLTQLIFSCVANSGRTLITGDKKARDRWYDTTIELLAIIKKPGHDPQAFETHPVYISFIICNSIRANIANYNDDQDLRSLLTLVLSQAAINRYLNRTNKKNDIYYMTEIAVAAYAAFVFEFHDKSLEYLKKLGLLTLFQNRSHFEQLHNRALSTFSMNGSDNEKCLLYWFQIYELLISLKKFQSPKTCEQYKFDDLFKFISSLDLRKVISELHDGLIFYWPEMSSGYNIYYELIDNTTFLLCLSEGLFSTHIEKMNFDKIIQLECNDPAFTELKQLLQLKLNALNYKLELYSIKNVQTLAFTKTYEGNLEHFKLHNDGMENLRLKIAAVKKQLSAIEEKINAANNRHNTYFDFLNNLTKSLTSRKSTAKKPDFSSSENQKDSPEDKPDCEAAQPENNLDEIQTLIFAKDFPRAYAKALALLNNNKDNKSIFTAYYYLADIYQYAADCQPASENDELINKANEYYALCIAAMEKYLSNEHDEEIHKLKLFLEATLKDKEIPTALINDAPIPSSPQIMEENKCNSDFQYLDYLPKYVFDEFALFPKDCEVYLVGGAVRDGDPNNDYDIVTSLSMTDIMALPHTGKLIPAKVPFFSIQMPNQKELQITSFSSITNIHSVEILKHPYGDGILIIHGTNKEKDAAKRLFTIDAIFYDPRKKVFFDPYNGRKDNQEKKLRFILDPVQTILNYKPTIFRAIRHIAKGYQLDINDKNKLIEHLPLLQKENYSRIHQEINRTLMKKNHEIVLEQFREFNIFHHVYGLSQEQSDSLLNILKPALNNMEIKKDDTLLWSVIINAEVREKIKYFSPDDLIAHYQANFHLAFITFRIFDTRAQDNIGRIILLTHFKMSFPKQMDLLLPFNFSDHEHQLSEKLKKHYYCLLNEKFDLKPDSTIASKSGLFSKSEIKPVTGQPAKTPQRNLSLNYPKK